MSEVYQRGPGYEALWAWFGLSRASWMTLPRVLMHEMPDSWQQRMAELLDEWDEANRVFTDDIGSPDVINRENGRISKFPPWILNYRHPDREEIRKAKGHSL